MKRQGTGMRAEENQKLCQREQQVTTPPEREGEREQQARERKRKKWEKDYLDQDTNYTFF